jgi:NAD(P)-dependent dehydrogenase (short-subunit alcohol dehydrogenase family)
MTKEWTDVQQLWREKAPMRRAAQPEDVADLVSALSRNTYVTGEVIMLDGGLNLR